MNYEQAYKNYFIEFNRLAVGKYASLSYGSDKVNDTAATLESILEFADIVRDYDGIPIILNGGAGASSWMLRQMFKGLVTCADPHDLYREYVEYICAANNIDSDRFEKEVPIMFSTHTFWDYGDIERIPYLGSVIDSTLHCIYIDDTSDQQEHGLPFRELVIKLCDKKGLAWRDSKRDAQGRGGIIILKNK